ncbi:MAG TPA: GNAT family N-acetyltransferase [Candidatus Paceibacterota bacterium]|nr:GNAT family N-acetyltransferase [Candidatus Paceibacterota bacterium]
MSEFANNEKFRFPKKFVNDVEFERRLTPGKIQQLGYQEFRNLLKVLESSDGKELHDEVLAAIVDKAITARKWIPHDSTESVYFRGDSAIVSYASVYVWGDFTCIFRYARTKDEAVFLKLIEMLIKHRANPGLHEMIDAFSSFLRNVSSKNIAELASGAFSEILSSRNLTRTDSSKSGSDARSQETVKTYRRIGHVDKLERLLDVIRAELFAPRSGSLGRALGGCLSKIISNQSNNRDATLAFEIINLMTTERVHSEVAKRRLRTVDTRAAIEEYSSNLKSFVNTLASKKDTNYLLTRVAISRARAQLERPPYAGKLHANDFVPRQIAKNVYGIYEEKNGEPLLLFAPPNENREINALLEEFYSLAPQVEKHRADRARLVEGQDYPDNWPQELKDEYEYMYPAEIRESQLLLKLRSFFFHEDLSRIEKGEWIGSYSGEPRMERAVDLTDLLHEYTQEWEPDSGNAITASLLKRLLSEAVMTDLSRNLGVDLSQLSLRELSYCYQSLLALTNDRAKEVARFCKQHGLMGLRTFLSLEHDRSMGEKILEFASSAVANDEKRRIFEIYGGIIDMAQEEGVDADVAALIEKSARDVLTRAHQYREEPERLRKMLQKISIEGQALIGIFRARRERGMAKSLEDISGISYDVIDGSNVLAHGASLDVLTKLYWKNYRENPATAAMLVEKFKKNLAEQGAQLHRVTFKNKIIGFMLVVPVGEKRLHVSALNVDEELVGLQAGPTLIKKVLDLVQEGNTITAEAVPRLAEQYEKFYGFEKAGEFIDDDGEHLFKLELRPPSKVQSSTALQTKNGGENK